MPCDECGAELNATKQIKTLKEELSLTECQVLAKESLIIMYKQKIEKIKLCTLHAGCNGNPQCHLCPIVAILEKE